MPFCTQCGDQVGQTDQFCASCGSRQGTPAAGASSTGTGFGAAGGAGAPPPNDAGKVANQFLGNLSPHTAAILCYIPIVGWVASIVILASERFREDRDTRFHAFQGLYLFVVWLFVDWVFGPITDYASTTRFIGKAMKITVFGTWIFMLIKTSQDQLFRLPILGDLADRSVSEQR